MRLFVVLLLAEVTDGFSLSACASALARPRVPACRHRAKLPPACTPSAELTPAEIPTLLMRALERNDFPEVDAGLMSMWEFASDTTRFFFKSNLTDFIESAHETAAEYPTSFYGMALCGREWSLEGDVTMVGGDVESSWVATQMMRTVASDGRMRRWQWELRKRRQPPRRGWWHVESIGSSDRHGNFEVD